MFISENHPDRAALLARQQPPEPSGRVLARIPRRGFAGKPPGELVVSLECLEGREFISLRAWQSTPAGMRPGKFMATVRLAEAEEVAAAILEGLRLAENPPARAANSTSGRGRQGGGASGAGSRRSGARISLDREPDPPLFAGRAGDPQAYPTDFDEFGSAAEWPPQSSCDHPQSPVSVPLHHR